MLANNTDHNLPQKWNTVRLKEDTEQGRVLNHIKHPQKETMSDTWELQQGNIKSAFSLIHSTARGMGEGGK